MCSQEIVVVGILLMKKTQNKAGATTCDTLEFTDYYENKEIHYGNKNSNKTSSF